MTLLALASSGSGCTEPVDCSAEPDRCVQQPARPPLKLPQPAVSREFDADKARANLLRLGRRDGLRPIEAADEARLRAGAAKAAAAALAKAEAPGPAPMRPDALARAGALPSDTLAARRRPDPQALAAAQLPTAPSAVPAGGQAPVRAVAEDPRVADLRRFLKQVSQLVGARSLDKLAPVLHPDYLNRLREVVPANEERFWTHATRYAAILGPLPASGAGLALTLAPGAKDDELQLHIAPADGKMPLRPIVVRVADGWKLRRF